MSSTIVMGDPAAYRDGLSFADAVIVSADSDEAGIVEEHQFVRAHACAHGRGWRPALQRMIVHGDVPYDVIWAVCSHGCDRRAFYFDIRNYYGKL